MLTAEPATDESVKPNSLDMWGTSPPKAVNVPFARKRNVKETNAMNQALFLSSILKFMVKVGL